MSITKLSKKVVATAQALTLGLGLTAASLALTGTALADCNDGVLNIQNGAQCAQANGTSSDLFAQGGVFQTISNTLIFLVGAVAVIMLIIGGLRYVISNGDPKNVSAAKDTILYAIIGIVVAIISFALVQFVINALSKSS